ncbi:hypothetical protein [Rhizobacter sp. OV335]|uniref:hypothetical protein n=1 Tax=Rhizobacter sp. OV335 TaxID=1500264 RepID=UPI0009233B1A|nr:hypothetical protein [Rhizobacter sp. OV335]SHM37514.1 hypothetical protein SAMN02787076_01143 [Rhizobacter sp. OV335]
MSRTIRRFARGGVVAAYSVAAACVLSACGGGGDGGAGPTTPDPGPPTPTGLTLSGKVMRGYLQGAVVCVDANDDLQCNGDEPLAVTDAQGDYTLVLSAAQAALLASARLVAQVPASAIDASTGAPVGSEQVLLARPYEAGRTAYFFTPVRTRVEQLVWSGVVREDAEAVVRRGAGLVDLAIDDDYIAGAAGLHGDEAAWVREQAAAWFGQQTRGLMAMLHRPSDAWFNAQAGAGAFELSADPGRDGTVFTATATNLAPSPVAGEMLASRRTWSFDPAVDTAFHGYAPISERSDFLDETAGWLDGDPQGTLAQRLDAGRVLQLRSGIAIAAEFRDVEDLAGRAITRDDVGGSADVAVTGTYPEGAQRFRHHARVQWRAGGYARVHEEGEPFGMTLASLDQFIALRQVQADGSGSWRALRGMDASAVEMGFDGQGGVIFRDTATLQPLGGAAIETFTFGGVPVLRVPLSDQASAAEFGVFGVSLYFAVYRGVHQLDMVEVGGMEVGAEGRWVNRVATNALTQALTVPVIGD